MRYLDKNKQAPDCLAFMIKFAGVWGWAIPKPTIRIIRYRTYIFHHFSSTPQSPNFQFGAAEGHLPPSASPHRWALQLRYFPTSIDNLTTQRRTCPTSVHIFANPKTMKNPAKPQEFHPNFPAKNSKMPSKSHPLLSITVRWRCPWWVTTPELSRFGALRSSFLRASAARPTPPWWRSMASDRTWEIWCWISSGCLRVQADRKPGFSWCRAVPASAKMGHDGTKRIPNR